MALNTTMHNRPGHLKVFDFEFCAIQRTTYIVLTIEAHFLPKFKLVCLGRKLA